MTDKIVQLVDKDENNLYPVAGSLKDGSVTTSTIDDEAVTADKIKLSTIVDTIGTKTGNNRNYCIKYADGTMIAVIRKTYSGIGTTTWGPLYEHEFSTTWLGNWAVPFVETPVVSYFNEGGFTWWVANKAGSSASKTAPGGIDLIRATSASNGSGVISAIAIGRWK